MSLAYSCSAGANCCILPYAYIRGLIQEIGRGVPTEAANSFFIQTEGLASLRNVETKTTTQRCSIRNTPIPHFKTENSTKVFAADGDKASQGFRLLAS